MSRVLGSGLVAQLAACCAGLLVLLAACAAPNPPRPQEAPGIQFKRAVVVAAVAPQQRAPIEDRVAEEIRRRRPGSKVLSSHVNVADLATISPGRFRAYVDAQGFDVVITIVPFEDEELTLHDDWADVAGRELGRFLVGKPVHGLLGTFGVQVIAWDAKTKEPLFSYLRQPGGAAPEATDLAVDRMMGDG